MQIPPEVLAVGSCRIFRPLRRLDSQGGVKLLNSDRYYWFTHSAQSGQQYLEAIKGSKSIPEPHRPFFMETDLSFHDDLTWHDAPNPDLIILEVSSLKDYQLEETHLNAHLTYSIAKEAGLDPSQFMRNPNTYKGEISDPLLSQIRMTSSTTEEIISAARFIRDTLNAPVLTVNHLHYVDPNSGGQLSGRPEITAALTAASRVEGIDFYNTASVIAEVGQSNALTDPQHYATDIELRVGQEIMSNAARLI